MVKFKLSAFADEYSPNFDKQLEGLRKNGVEMMEIRGVDGTNIADITTEKAKEIKLKLDKSGIKVSAIGSPLGKIKITDPIEPHLDQLRRVIEIAKILDTKRIRMFSFYMPEGEKPEKYRDEVFKRLEKMLEIARKLSKDFKFVRVDLHNVDGKIYFGEMTFTPASGYMKFSNPKYDRILGDMLDLKK